MDKGIEAIREAVRRAPLIKPEGLSPAWQAYFDAVTPLRVAEMIAALEQAQQELIKPLAIGELTHRLENQTGEKWIREAAPSGMMQLSNEPAETKRKSVELPRFAAVTWHLSDVAKRRTSEENVRDVLDAIRTAGGTVEGE